MFSSWYTKIKLYDKDELLFKKKFDLDSQIMSLIHEISDINEHNTNKILLDDINALKKDVRELLSD
jgi:hypothetical protein